MAEIWKRSQACSGEIGNPYPGLHGFCITKHLPLTPAMLRINHIGWAKMAVSELKYDLFMTLHFPSPGRLCFGGLFLRSTVRVACVFFPGLRCGYPTVVD